MGTKELKDPTEAEISQAKIEISQLLTSIEGNCGIAYAKMTDEALINIFATTTYAQEKVPGETEQMLLQLQEHFIIYVLAQRGITITEGGVTVTIEPQAKA